MLQFDVNLMDGISRAIRSFPTRTGDIAQSFKANQLLSKQEVVSRIPAGSNVCILGGWYALGFMLTNPHSATKFTSVDIDPECVNIGRCIGMPGYTHVCADALRYNTDPFDVVVNCSTEHMDYDLLQFSFSNIRSGKLCIFQNNNNSFIDDHINCFDSANSFTDYIEEQFRVVECATTQLYGSTERYTILCRKM